ncbi:TPA: DUF2732 family protein [Yersinia enterocolitica]|nr:DUF2732 family protein [Yersinia enterocolitica]HDM8293540.1 DUF2732 family protein [Yersinia enterocolitica]HDM8318795.1 DUF2732 family protein [Yersinia enterocolitica]HDM8331178.1 DUF2732 family protein [Yersinia enterocolitica]
MQNTPQKIWIGVDHAKPGSENTATIISVESMELMLNDARRDERKNQAELVALRLGGVVNKILNRELDCWETADLLNHIVEGILNQAQAQH